MLEPFYFISEMNDKIGRYVYKMDEFTPEDLGFDRRAAYRVYVDKDRTCIVINKNDDKHFQYYGGMEYVDRDCRTEMGDWVFYFADDERVQGHLDHLNEELVEDEA